MANYKAPDGRTYASKESYERMRTIQLLKKYGSKDVQKKFAKESKKDTRKTKLQKQIDQGQEVKQQTVQALAFSETPQTLETFGTTAAPGTAVITRRSGAKEFVRGGVVEATKDPSGTISYRQEVVATTPTGKSINLVQQKAGGDFYYRSEADLTTAKKELGTAKLAVSSDKPEAVTEVPAPFTAQYKPEYVSYTGDAINPLTGEKMKLADRLSYNYKVFTSERGLSGKLYTESLAAGLEPTKAKELSTLGGVAELGLNVAAGKFIPKGYTIVRGKLATTAKTLLPGESGLLLRSTLRGAEAGLATSGLYETGKAVIGGDPGAAALTYGGSKFVTDVAYPKFKAAKTAFENPVFKATGQTTGQLKDFKYKGEGALQIVAQPGTSLEKSYFAFTRGRGRVTPTKEGDVSRIFTDYRIKTGSGEIVGRSESRRLIQSKTVSKNDQEFFISRSKGLSQSREAISLDSDISVAKKTDFFEGPGYKIEKFEGANLGISGSFTETTGTKFKGFFGKGQKPGISASGIRSELFVISKEKPTDIGQFRVKEQFLSKSPTGGGVFTQQKTKTTPLVSGIPKEVSSSIVKAEKSRLKGIMTDIKTTTAPAISIAPAITKTKTVQTFKPITEVRTIQTFKPTTQFRTIQTFKPVTQFRTTQQSEITTISGIKSTQRQQFQTPGLTTTPITYPTSLTISGPGGLVTPPVPPVGINLDFGKGIKRKKSKVKKGKKKYKTAASPVAVLYGKTRAFDKKVYTGLEAIGVKKVGKRGIY